MGRPPLIGDVPSFCYENGWLNCDFQHGYMRRAVEHGDTTGRRRAMLHRQCIPARHIGGHQGALRCGHARPFWHVDP
jgi:hypothetical protein